MWDCPLLWREEGHNLLTPSLSSTFPPCNSLPSVCTVSFVTHLMKRIQVNGLVGFTSLKYASFCFSHPILIIFLSSLGPIFCFSLLLFSYIFRRVPFVAFPSSCRRRSVSAAISMCLTSPPSPPLMLASPSMPRPRRCLPLWYGKERKEMATDVNLTYYYKWSWLVRLCSVSVFDLLNLPF